MYCRKCGKFIDYDAEQCLECASKGDIFTYVEEQVKVESVKTETVKVEPQPEQIIIEEVSFNGANVSASQTTVTSFKPIKDKTYGFKKALPAFILAVIAAICSSFFDGFYTTAVQMWNLGEIGVDTLNTMMIICLVCMIVSCVFAIPSIILAVLALITFKQAKNQGIKSQKTLVFGVIAVALATYSIMMALMNANYLIEAFRFIASC